MPITFARVQEYLDKIASHIGAVDISNSPHGAFWRTPTRDQFVAMNVPNVSCRSTSGSTPIPIVKVGDALDSPILKILIADRAVCNKPQMPKTGPFITDQPYSITLSDGTSVTGAQIQKDIKDWIDAGCPL